MATSLSPHSADPGSCRERRWYGGMGLTSTFSPAADLAPGVDEIYEESKEVFLTPGHPQDGQVVFYKVGSLRGCLCSPGSSSASQSGAVSCWVPAPWHCVVFGHICLGHEQVTDAGSHPEGAERGPAPGDRRLAAPLSRLQQHQVCVEGGICETDTAALVLPPEVTESPCLSPFRSALTEV